MDNKKIKEIFVDDNGGEVTIVFDDCTLFSIPKSWYVSKSKRSSLDFDKVEIAADGKSFRFGDYELTLGSMFGE